MSNIVNMTEGSAKKHILKFAYPIFISQLLQQLYNTVDAAIVGKALGKQALAAVTSSGTLIFLLISFFVGTTMGAGVVISRYFGAKDEDNMSKAIHTNIALGLICGVVLTIVGIWGTPAILRWMDTDPNVLPSSIIYFRWYFVGGLSIVMYNTLKGIMNAVGDSKRPLYFLIISSVLNVVLDLLFVVVFDFGVGGAALATTISQTFSFVLCLFALLREKSSCRLQIKKIRIHFPLLKEIVKYGLPSGIQNSVIALANVIVQSYINGFGENAMAAYGSHAKVEGFAFLPITCFTMAITTFVSQNLGAKRYDRAKEGARFGITASVLIAESIGVLVYFLCPYVLRIFTDDPAVLELAIQQARTLCFFYCLLAFSHCIAAICRGAGKAIVPMAVMLTVWCAIRIAYICIVMGLTDNIGLIYWAYPITWGISSIIYLIYYFKSDWVHGYEKPSRLSLHMRH